MAVYMIQAGMRGPVKIGKAKDVARRIAVLQCGHSETLKLIREIAGDHLEEGWLHNHFRSQRVRGEWFAFHPDMLVVEVPQQMPHRRYRTGFDAVLERWPSAHDFASDIGVPVNTAVAMRRRGSIKSAHWGQVIAAARRRGFDEINIELLCACAAERLRRRHAVSAKAA